MEAAAGGRGGGEATATAGAETSCRGQEGKHGKGGGHPDAVGQAAAAAEECCGGWCHRRRASRSRRREGCARLRLGRARGRPPPNGARRGGVGLAASRHREGRVGMHRARPSSYSLAGGRARPQKVMKAVTTAVSEGCSASCQRRARGLASAGRGDRARDSQPSDTCGGGEGSVC